MSIVEFLLARIAEDEEIAHRMIDEVWPAEVVVATPDNGNNSVAISQWGPKAYTRIWEIDPPDSGWRFHASGMEVWGAKEGRRRLAECEAKRAIVEAHQRQVADDDPDAWIVLSESLLRHLAAVYADHPDYRQEWTA